MTWVPVILIRKNRITALNDSIIHNPNENTPKKGIENEIISVNCVMKKEFLWNTIKI